MKIVARYTQESKNVDISPVYTCAKKCRHRSSLLQYENVYIGPVCTRVKKVDIGPVYTSVKKVDIDLVYTRNKKNKYRSDL